MHLPGIISVDECVSTSDINCQIGHWIVKVGYPAILIIATSGHLFALAVLCRKRFRENATFVCFSFLSAVDIVFIWTVVARPVFLENNGVDLNDVSNLLCRLSIVAAVGSQFMSAYISAFIGLLRYCYLQYPLKARRTITTRRTVIAIMAMAGFCIVDISFTGFGFEAFVAVNGMQNSTTDRQLECSAISESFGKYSEILLIKYAIVNNIIPLFIISISSFMIVKKLILTSNASTNSIQETASSIAARSQTTKTVAVVNIFYLIASTPFHAHIIYRNTSTLHNEQSNELKLVGDILFLLLLLNHTFNFIVNTFAGSRYKNEAVIMIKELKNRCCRRQA